MVKSYKKIFANSLFIIKMTIIDWLKTSIEIWSNELNCLITQIILIRTHINLILLRV